MAWYGNDGWDYYPPYNVSGGQEAHGARALAKLLRKSKRSAEPVVIAHRQRQLTITFWGKAWSDNLERLRRPRQPPAARARLSGNGSVLDLAIAGPGRGTRGGQRAVPRDDRHRPMANARWRRRRRSLTPADRLARGPAAR